ncbi:hypothetical protein [Fervidobacterium thailandense]|uniref:Type II/III secretion system secretin-like domain-containing protein n=1 Tax=Fervidobacterium thailandense TaxID=1008305 RepID=A0A1E3G1R7_9BACT|nr:hypothetical protein [Fervidobacterium thailandense]ODN30090.1 hypothetical protein A4H02_07240 [Fervidobacterium thailandense]
MRFSVILLFLSVLIFCQTLVFSSLVDVNYTSTQNEVVLIFSFSSTPRVLYYGQNQSSTVHYFHLSNSGKYLSYVPVSTGSVEGVQIVPADVGLDLFVFCLTPVRATHNVVGNKLYVRFPRSFSPKRITVNFLGIKSDLFLREISEYFGIDIFLYDGAKGKVVNLKLTEATLEDVIRSFLSSSGLSYAYGSGKVLYFGTVEEISKNFAMSWQVYDKEVNLEKLKEIFGKGTYVAYTKDKSKLFVYGGLREYKLIAEALVTEPSKNWIFVKYPDGATDREIEDLLKRFAEGTDLKYMLLPANRQIALLGNQEEIEKLSKILAVYKPAVLRSTSTIFSFVQVSYPERVKEAILKVVPDIKVDVQGNLLIVPKEFEDFARTLASYTSVASPYRITLDDVSEETVKGAARALGISEKDMIVTASANKVHVVLFTTESLYQRFLTLVDTLEQKTEIVRASSETVEKYKLKTLERYSDGSVLVSGKRTELEKLRKELESKTTVVVKANPADPPVEILSRILGYTVEENQGYIVAEVSKSDVEEFQKRLQEVRESYGRKMVITVNSYSEEIKKIAADLYKVSFYASGDNLLIVGINAVEAKKFLDTFLELPDQFIAKVDPIDEQLGNMLSKLFKVEVYRTEGATYLVGKKVNVDLAKQYIEAKASDVVNLKVKISNEVIEYVKALYGVSLSYFSELNVALLSGSKDQVQKAKKFLESLEVSTEVAYIDLGSTLKEEDINNLVQLLGLKIDVKKIGPGVYISGERSAVVKLKNEVENLKKTIETKNPVVTNSYVFLTYPEELDEVVRKIFEGVKTFKLGSGYVVYGTTEQVKLVEQFVNEFSPYVQVPQPQSGELSRELTFESTIVTLETTLDEEQVKTIASIFEENVKFVKKIGNKLYLAGRKESVLKIRDEISKYKPDTEYAVISGKLLVDVKQKPLHQLIIEVSKLLGEEVVVVGNLDSTVSLRIIVKSFPELLAHLNSYGVRYDKVGTVFRVYGVSDKISSDNFVTIVGEDSLYVFVKNQSLTDVVSAAAQALKKSVVFENFEDIKVTLSLVGATFEGLLRSVEVYGVTYEQKDGVYYIRKQVKIPEEKAAETVPSVISVDGKNYVDVKDGKITLYFSKEKVDEIVRQVLTKLGKSFKVYPVDDTVHSLLLIDVDYETFKAIFSEWVEFREENGIVYVASLPKKIPEPEKKEMKVVQVNNGKITINAENHDLSEIIKDVFRGLGYSIVFSKPVDKKATMAVSEVDFETFKSIVLNYGVSLKQSGNLYFVDITPEATKVINTYTFNVVRGADKVKELIEFYGGKATVNSDAGIVIAYNLDPKNVDDIRHLIDKVSRAKLVSIEARVVDTSLLDSIGIDLGFYLNSQDTLQISSRDGLKLSLKVLELFDFENLWKRILDNAQIGINATTGQAGSVQATQGNTKLLASPNIVAKSGESARIFIGDSIPIVLRDAQTGQLSLQYLEAGIELRITPRVNPDDSIELDLYTAVGNFDFTTQVGGYPRTSKREATTKLTLKDGQTLVIGGLAREEKSQQTWKVPILGDLPIIGMLFRGTRESVETRNIVIFLTARIIEQ